MSKREVQLALCDRETYNATLARRGNPNARQNGTHGVHELSAKANLNKS